MAPIFIQMLPSSPQFAIYGRHWRHNLQMCAILFLASQELCWRQIHFWIELSKFTYIFRISLKNFVTIIHCKPMKSQFSNGLAFQQIQVNFATWQSFGFWADFSRIFQWKISILIRFGRPLQHRFSLTLTWNKVTGTWRWQRWVWSRHFSTLSLF